jgi:hypothetical protein
MSDSLRMRLAVVALLFAAWTAYGEGGLPFLPSGPRAVLIIHEAGDTTPTLARLKTGLRTGEAAKYLKEKGHTLLILDDDAKDQNDQPSPVVAHWKPHLEGVTLPAIVIGSDATNPAAGSLIHRQSLPPEATPASTLEILKANGG